MRSFWIAVIALPVLAACSTTSTRVAPVVNLTASGAAAAKTAGVHDWRPPTHVVQKGDTLYAIALEYGLDYHELADWNHLGDTNHIQVGQTLQLTAPAAVGAAQPQAQAQSQAVHIEAVTSQALPSVLSINQPQAVKLPYSPGAVAQLQQADAQPQPAPQVTPSPVVNPPAAVDKAAPSSAAASGGDAADASLDWVWPAAGKLIANFGDAGSEGKGIDIGGTRGEAVVAAAAGKVVYSGSGLHGYGKLVIIKHNANYLSAYAHNEQILVKEGQTVGRGQKIAEMGDSDADRVELHFEIRQMGKPVDPMKFLPKPSD